MTNLLSSDLIIWNKISNVLQFGRELKSPKLNGWNINQFNFTRWRAKCNTKLECGLYYVPRSSVQSFGCDVLCGAVLSAGRVCNVNNIEIYETCGIKDDITVLFFNNSLLFFDLLSRKAFRDRSEPFLQFTYNFIVS